MPSTTTSTSTSTCRRWWRRQAFVSSTPTERTCSTPPRTSTRRATRSWTGSTASLRERLVAAGGDRYASFPHVGFGADDITVLREVEESLTAQERYDAAFLRWYLVDTRPDGR